MQTMRDRNRQTFAVRARGERRLKVQALLTPPSTRSAADGIVVPTSTAGAFSNLRAPIGDHAGRSDEERAQWRRRSAPIDDPPIMAKVSEAIRHEGFATNVFHCRSTPIQRGGQRRIPRRFSQQRAPRESGPTW
jgi:hypothetical protein